MKVEAVPAAALPADVTLDDPRLVAARAAYLGRVALGSGVARSAGSDAGAAPERGRASSSVGSESGGSVTTSPAGERGVGDDGPAEAPAPKVGPKGRHRLSGAARKRIRNRRTVLGLRGPRPSERSKASLEESGETLGRLGLEKHEGEIYKVISPAGTAGPSSSSAATQGGATVERPLKKQRPAQEEKAASAAPKREGGPAASPS